MNPAITPVDGVAAEATAAELSRHAVPAGLTPAWGMAAAPPVGAPPAEMPKLAGADLGDTVRLLRPGGLPADPAELTVLEGLWLRRQRQLTAQQWVEALLRRIQAVEPFVQAWVTLLSEAARTAAVRGDAHPDAPLAGAPVGIKDIIDVRGVRTTAGSRSLADHVASETAACVARLQGAGAIVIGKTSTVEFAVGTPAATRNPWRLDHTPGGSSSGSAAAVAARMVPAALGSQTGGSIIRPSAFCGVVGLKPTYGRVPVDGVIPLSWTMDHVGPIARTVADAALVFQALVGDDRPRLPGVGVKGLRIGVPDRYFFTACDPEVAAAAHEALREFERLGAALVPARLPATFEAARPANQLIMCAELAAYHRHAYAARPGEYGAETAGRIQAGRAVRAETYLMALQVRARFGADLLAAMDALDVLATPSAPTPAPPGLASTGDPAFNSPFSLIGFPSLTVPAGFTAAGLPLGLQLVGRPYAEAVLLTAGHTFEAGTDWHLRRPPTPSIRTAAARDWPAVEVLLGEAGLPLAGAREHLGRGRFILAVDDAGAVWGVGGLEVHGDVALLRSLAVCPQRRGKGVGAALVRALLASAERQGARGVYLLTTTAASYFPRFGFQVIARSEMPAALGESEELRAACPASAVAMRLGADRGRA